MTFNDPGPIPPDAIVSGTISPDAVSTVSSRSSRRELERLTGYISRTLPAG